MSPPWLNSNVLQKSQWGSQSAISDLTEAGGWTIMGCNATASSQAVRVVCNSADEEAAGCTHVLQNGAKDTVVRLPEAVRNGSFDQL
jgi:hypothetical protein